MTGTGNDGEFQEFISDPKKPVPLRKILKGITPRKYMTDDQRFAARRPDVLVYETEILKDNMTLVIFGRIAGFNVRNGCRLIVKSLMFFLMMNRNS
jgi:predicted acyl esterase